MLLELEPEDLGLPGAKVAVTLRHARCSRHATTERLEAPSTIWLSTQGIEVYEVLHTGSGAVVEQLSFSLSYDAQSGVSLGANAEKGSWSSGAQPDTVGQRISLAGHCIEVAAVEPGAGVTYADNRWTSAEGYPALHVALFVSPTECDSR